MDVAQNHQVWDRDPCPQPASQTQGERGRPARKLTPGDSQARCLSVSALKAESFEKESRKLTIRETTKGPLRARIWGREVWQWDGKSQKARRRLLVVRQEEDGSFKYSLSNAPSDTSWERLARVQAQRYWIERARHAQRRRSIENHKKHAETG